MTKAEYLAELRHRLRALPEYETQDALDYYEGYLEDAGNDVSAAIEGLGSPAEVAAQILASYAVRPKEEPIDKTSKKRKGGLGFLWTIILAVFAVPIGLPVALAVVIIALAFLITLFAVILSIGASGAGLIIGGVASIVLSPFVMPQGLAVGIALLGAGCICAGLGVILFRATVALARGGFNGIARFVGKTIIRGRAQ